MLRAALLFSAASSHRASAASLPPQPPSNSSSRDDVHYGRRLVHSGAGFGLPEPWASLADGRDKGSGLNEWKSSKYKRCNMFEKFFRGPNPAPGYVDGTWVPQDEKRRSILTSMPFECVEAKQKCPIEGCSNSGEGQISGYCAKMHDSCYANRATPTFDNNLKNMVYTWKPSNGCFLSPLAIMSTAQYRSWAQSIEAAAGPILFLGDTLLWELYYAFRTLTADAPNSKFVRSDTLVNTYTLSPLSIEQLDACLAVTNPVPNPGPNYRDPPCPPNQMSPHWWEDNRWHQIENLKWPKTLLETGRPDHYKTLVIGFGSELWKSHKYPAMMDGCKTQGGLADAFQPITALGYGLPDWHLAASCDVFSTRYPIIVQNIARFLGNLHVGAQYFDGHVIFMTTPPHVQGCSSITAPNAAPSEGPQETDKTSPAYYYKQVQYAESIWWSAFQKWAPRLKLSVLNVTHLSAMRADARTPGDCGHFCYPGLPHVWAEMLLRLLEQHHFKY